MNLHHLYGIKKQEIKKWQNTTNLEKKGKNLL
jgi:hypothetical protein